MHRTRVGRPVDPEDLQSLLDYRDARARAEAKLGRAKEREYDDRRRAGVPEPDDVPVAPASAKQEPRHASTPESQAAGSPHDDSTLAPGQTTGESRSASTTGDSPASGTDQHDTRKSWPRLADNALPDDTSPPLSPPVDSARTADNPTHDQNEQRSIDERGSASNAAHKAEVDTRSASVEEVENPDDRVHRTVADQARSLHYDVPPEVVTDLGFDPGRDRGALGDHFRPGLLDPYGEIARKESTEPKIAKKELALIQYLIEERRALITVLPESQVQGVKNPDTIVRWGPTDEGGTLELKTLASANQGAIEQNLRRGSAQLAGRPDPQLIIDGRDVHATESSARQAFARRLRVSSSTVPTVHFILDRGQWLTLPDGEKKGS